MTRHLGLLVAVGMVLLAAACGEEGGDARTYAMELKGLDAFCQASACAGVNEWLVRVQVKVDGKLELLDPETFSSEGSSLSLSDIPETEEAEVTLLGLTGKEGDVPVAFARASGFFINKNATTHVAVTPAAYADFSCVGAPASAPNLMFASSTRLPDGKVLIAGGFAKAVEEAGRTEVTAPSNRGYIYDPETGKLSQIQTLMNEGRGAHAAVYIPAGYVLLVGGAERLYADKKQDCFPWYFLKDKAGDVGSTYELFDVKSMKFLAWDKDWPDTAHTMIKQVKRIFPALALNVDGTVLVTGGGQWPSCSTPAESDADYQIAEFYCPKEGDQYTGGFKDTFGALTMKGMRTAHTSVVMDTKDKLNYHLFWGGSVDGPIAEVYRESSGQKDLNFGAFGEVEFVDPDAYNKRPYFHTMTPLANRQFLLLGGTENSKGKLKVPSAGHAYLLRITTPDEKVELSKVEGLANGRYFHTVVAAEDGTRAAILGGYSSVVGSQEEVLFGNIAIADTRFFDLSKKEIVLPLAKAENGSPLAGAAAQGLFNGCMLIVGGVDQPSQALEAGSKPKGMIAETYCPSMVCPEGLWDSVCYQE